MPKSRGVHAVTLTDRDLHLITLLYDYNGADISLLARRFWPRVRSASSYYQRLRQLVAAKYLQAKRIPLISGGPGGTLFLTVGPAARPILAKLLCLASVELRRATRAVNPFEVAHRSSLGHVRLSIELAADQRLHLSLAQWYSDVELTKAPLVSSDPSDPHGEPIRNIPDGAFILATPKGPLTAYLELDLSTITRPQVMRRRLRGYLLHRRTLLKARPVLLVTHSAKRQARLASWCQAEAKLLRLNPTIFHLTTRDRLTEHTVLAQPIWQVVGREQPQPLLPASLLTASPPPMLSYGSSLVASA